MFTITHHLPAFLGGTQRQPQALQVPHGLNVPDLAAAPNQVQQLALMPRPFVVNQQQAQLFQHLMKLFTDPSIQRWNMKDVHRYGDLPADLRAAVHFLEHNGITTVQQLKEMDHAAWLQDTVRHFLSGHLLTNNSFALSTYIGLATPWLINQIVHSDWKPETQQHVAGAIGAVVSVLSVMYISALVAGTANFVKANGLGARNHENTAAQYFGPGMHLVKSEGGVLGFPFTHLIASHLNTIKGLFPADALSVAHRRHLQSAIGATTAWLGQWVTCYRPGPSALVRGNQQELDSIATTRAILNVPVPPLNYALATAFEVGRWTTDALKATFNPAQWHLLGAPGQGPAFWKQSATYMVTLLPVLVAYTVSNYLSQMGNMANKSGKDGSDHLKTAYIFFQLGNAAIAFWCLKKMVGNSMFGNSAPYQVSMQEAKNYAVQGASIAATSALQQPALWAATAGGQNVADDARAAAAQIAIDARGTNNANVVAANARVHTSFKNAEAAYHKALAAYHREDWTEAVAELRAMHTALHGDNGMNQLPALTDNGGHATRDNLNTTADALNTALNNQNVAGPRAQARAAFSAFNTNGAPNAVTVAGANAAEDLLAAARASYDALPNTNNGMLHAVEAQLAVDKITAAYDTANNAFGVMNQVNAPPQTIIQNADIAFSNLHTMQTELGKLLANPAVTVLPTGDGSNHNALTQTKTALDNAIDAAARVDAIARGMSANDKVTGDPARSDLAQAAQQLTQPVNVGRMPKVFMAQVIEGRLKITAANDKQRLSQQEQAAVVKELLLAQPAALDSAAPEVKRILFEVLTPQQVVELCTSYAELPANAANNPVKRAMLDYLWARIAPVRPDNGPRFGGADQGTREQINNQMLLPWLQNLGMGGDKGSLDDADKASLVRLIVAQLNDPTISPNAKDELYTFAYMHAPGLPPQLRTEIADVYAATYATRHPGGV
jgi:hypothetical protein